MYINNIDNDGEDVVVVPNASTDNATTGTTNKSVLEILLIGGVPLNEPVARYGSIRDEY
jgi:redox-sensitive bicupin YhaK (pirin superfamily)